MPLHGMIHKINELSAPDRERMYRLMCEFYEYMAQDAFVRDLAAKDSCIVLRDSEGVIQGFSTQKVLEVSCGRTSVWGVFSGDTIIHRDHWGSMELYQVFARHFFQYERQYGDFYWFLISKGYKTYRILPTFFRRFHPSCMEETPVFEKAVMDAFGAHMYPDDYNPATGVVEYRSRKDTLRPGVADVGPRQERDKHIAYFLRKNPGYAQGNDLVCLAKLSRENLKPRTLSILFGKEEPS